MAEIKLNNESSYEFFDVSCEAWREFIRNGKVVLRIEEPQWVAVSSTGLRVIDKNNQCYYIPYFSYDYLTWVPKKGKPHFIK